MTVTSEFMTTAQPYRASIGALDGSRMILRAAKRMTGIALVLAASGLWLAPGADWGNDVMLMKMGLSILALMIGFGLMLSGARAQEPELEIDTDRGEIRLVRPGTMNANLILQRCRFSELALVERVGNRLKFWDERGDFIADVYVTERAIMDRLLSGLRAAGQAV